MQTAAILFLRVIEVTFWLYLHLAVSKRAEMKKTW